MLSEMPLVSVIIPVYNGSNFMREAIDSALAQTYQNIEVLVINDGSSDDGKTAETARSYGDKIRYFEKENGGVSSALNLGIKNMNGSYFSWLSHDDVYEKTKIEKQIAIIREKRIDNLITYCSADFIDADSKPFTNSFSKKPDRLYNHKEALLYILQNSAAGCSFLIPKNVFEAVGLFDETLRYCQDIQMWWNIFLLDFPLYTSGDLGVHYRIHGSQVTQNMPEMYKTEAKIIADRMVNAFAEKSDKEYNYLYYYAKGEALHNNKSVFNLCIDEADKRNLFDFSQKTKLKAVYIYGCIRPAVRRLYYKLFKRVETK